jgi:serine/threonine protein kinase
MICCLNPDCTVENLPQPPEVQCCICGTKLVRLVGHYIPVSRLGKGAYGVTYKAEDTHKSNDHCAIKQLIVHNEKAKESFKKESEQLKKLNSKKCSRIPQMFGCFEQDGYLYLAQEFIDGKNLTTYLKEEGIFDEAQIRELLNQLLPVLKILHEEGIIHRDIKPDNIMRSIDGEYVLIDFGISKQNSGYHIPTPDTNVGTLGYAPKEQIKDKTTYQSSDLYSLGVVCYNLLTDKSPSEAFYHSGYSWTAHWTKCLSKASNSDLIKIIDKLLKEDYLDRYQTAEDVLKDLNPLPETKGLTEEDKHNRDTAILSKAGAKWGFGGNVLAFIAALIGLCTVLIGLNLVTSQ